MNKREMADIYQNEANPELYIEQRRAIRLRRLEEAVGAIVLVALIALTFTFVQVAYGIW